MRERDVEAYLVARVRALGGEVRKARWIGRSSAPDRRVMLPGRAPTWVEVKAPGKRPTAHQLREHARMRSLGEVVLVIDSLAGVEAMLS
jgi:hypothetical protein